MNGFDFDALRDSAPPSAGAGRRDAVHARARALRTRSRVRLALSSVSLVLVLTLVLGIAATRRDNGPRVIVQEPTATEPSSIGDRFIPPTTTEDGITTVPVTLPSGETFTLRYPESLRIAQLGFAGGINVDWPEEPALRCCGRTEALSMRYATIADVYGDEAPITTYPGATGDPVPMLRTPQVFTSTSSQATQVDLAFQFGPWLVRVAVTNLDDAGRALWARSLSGQVDEHGYLLVHAAAPFRMGTMFSGQFGAPVADADAVELSAYLHCGQAESDSTTHRRYSNDDGTYGVSWCVDDDIHVAATGTKRFVDQVDRGLRVSGFSPAPDEPPVATTTTTTPVPPPASGGGAVSASFVSPDQGRVLESNGAVAKTTDGGRTWNPVGRLRSELRQIRFADADNGFAFDDGDYSREAGVWATGDGGATWRPVSTPFPDPLELVIARDTVYAVALDEARGRNEFRLWSSTSDGSNWTEDAPVFPPAAGLSFEFAFADDTGWLVENGRGPIRGAKLSDGRWIDWHPPCTGVGAANIAIAAASDQDIAASCIEGAWTGPRLGNTFHISHDGGQTSQRISAPVAGLPLLADAETAVVASLGELYRTADGGQSWTLVGSNVTNVDAAAEEGGFTTPTQGFVISNDGTMLMSYDAGATWQPVTLP